MKIKITEAQFTGAKIIAKSDASMDERLPLGVVNKSQTVGEPLNLIKLEQSSLIVSEIPGTQANISLNPGKDDGTTEIDINLTRPKLISVTASVDNYGAVSTGVNRITTQTNLNGPLQRGDLWSLQTLQSEGLQYIRGSYSENIGFGGTRLGIYGSNMQYQLITPEYKDLDAYGPSTARGLEMSHPLIRSQTTSVTWQATIDQKHFNNTTISGNTSNYEAFSLNNTLLGNGTDERGATNASLQLTIGNMNLNGSPNQYSDSVTTDTQGDYSKAKLSLMRQQKISNIISLIGTYQAQLASKNLDGSEMIYLGGAQGIRAYPTNEGGGSIGQLVNFEVQNLYPWNQGSLILSPFIDSGKITVNKFNSYTQPVAVNNYGLSGAGFWVGINDKNPLGLYTLKLIVSRRIGSNPGQTQLGMDQNGTYVLNRLWLSANQSF